jgi:hypothetical protein
MCDVSNTICTVSFQENKQRCQVCKYPEKTNHRILKLTSKDKLSAPVSVPYSRHQQKPVSRPLDGGWKRNFREGDDDDDDENGVRPPLILNKPPSGLTGSLNSGHPTSYGAHKRPGTDGHAGCANNKKAKTAFAPALGKPGLMSILLRGIHAR